MFLEPSESWGHGGEATPYEPWLWREQPYRNKVQRRGEWEEVLNVSVFPSSKLLAPVNQRAATQQENLGDAVSTRVRAEIGRRGWRAKNKWRGAK